ncbi:cytochrome c oxidase assembly protein [Streptomyces sp. NPDC020731]|uniref:cytochrome c oxidase assembly protein n=1 Tax=Streptomyces sp. NPDC020731 TaxID=3365085 RepID=UPI0037B891B1
MTEHPPPAVTVAVLACVLVCAAYVAAAAGLRRRGDAWPWRRDCAFLAGGVALIWGLCGWLPGGPFTVHSARHLLVAMAGPVLLVVARPLTLALRVLPPGVLRRGLLRTAHSPFAAWLLFPPMAAVVDMGGLWLLFRTELLSAAHHRPALSAVLELHMLLAGLLFSAAVCQLDPVRRRWSPPLRAATLLLAGTAHAVLARSMYATGPPGTSFAPHDLRLGAQVMYYGGDAVEAVLALSLAVQWYATTGRRRARRAARSERGAPPVAPPPVRPGAAARRPAGVRATLRTRSSPERRTRSARR